MSVVPEEEKSALFPVEETCVQVSEKDIDCTLSVLQCIIRCDEDESHTASVYCTVCATHLCAECSQLTHSTRTLAKHRRVPLADKPHEKTLCPQHQVHAIEFVCLEEGCQPGPLMCCVCKEYGKHQGHKVPELSCPSAVSHCCRIITLEAHCTLM